MISSFIGYNITILGLNLVFPSYIIVISLIYIIIYILCYPYKYSLSSFQYAMIKPEGWQPMFELDMSQAQEGGPHSLRGWGSQFYAFFFCWKSW